MKKLWLVSVLVQDTPNTVGHHATITCCETKEEAVGKLVNKRLEMNETIKSVDVKDVTEYTLHMIKENGIK